jgi:hypothetical protein
MFRILLGTYQNEGLSRNGNKYPIGMLFAVFPATPESQDSRVTGLAGLVISQTTKGQLKS